jgi:hypothetical protein
MVGTFDFKIDVNGAQIVVALPLARIAPMASRSRAMAIEALKDDLDAVAAEMKAAFAGRRRTIKPRSFPCHRDRSRLRL